MAKMPLKFSTVPFASLQRFSRADVVHLIVK